MLPDVSPEERASSDLLKQIRKLRWIGMEQQAQRLQATLRTEMKPVGAHRESRSSALGSDL